MEKSKFLGEKSKMSEKKRMSRGRNENLWEKEKISGRGRVLSRTIWALPILGEVYLRIS